MNFSYAIKNRHLVTDLSKNNNFIYILLFYRETMSLTAWLMTVLTLGGMMSSEAGLLTYQEAELSRTQLQVQILHQQLLGKIETFFCYSELPPTNLVCGTLVRVPFLKQ